MIRLSFFICIMYLFTVNTNAQDCKHLFDSTPPLGEKYITKSDRLFEITKGNAIKVIRFLYGNSNYNIIITKDNPNLKIGLKLIDTKNLEVLWDNINKDLSEEINISLDNSCRVAIEITSLAENEQQTDCIALTIRSFKNHTPIETDNQSTPNSPPDPDWQ
ncbi:hypothetical protein [Carboxylicivirga caseinilyticus]|uniref:hypothetical protein n=1 Tax=Carboxylicivirga caseinilyticus TaxID=3417572 RepID=UPI003D3258C3|nr:hypothetical protein [Marinilabiliaceae bacterium A049]